MWNRFKLYDGNIFGEKLYGNYDNEITDQTA